MDQEPVHPFVEEMSRQFKKMTEEQREYTRIAFENLKRYMEEHPNWREELVDGKVDLGEGYGDL